ncbi:autoimmune regulator-like isoform X1 [Ictalurus furcatus]|uniref:autoimmune regulator-like isoform X1 n=2 Tax=Ictalurus furcatus TaxID=66913 RepID=UPI00235037F1|nr:autoimmune regulator-like isoform X1 [Ictalurus furcatus]
MCSDRISIQLDLTPLEVLIKFFRLNKAQISCIDEPLTFLNQLRDRNLVPDERYQMAIKMRNKERRQGVVYQILDWLEKQGGESVKMFWRSVFQDHIVQRYPALRTLQTSFLDGSFRSHEFLQNLEKPIGSEEKETEQERPGTKRKKGTDETEEEESPSSVSSSSQKRPAMEPTLVESTGSNPQSRRTPCPNNPLDQANDDACFICNEEGVLVHCKECPRAFHHYCHLPIPQDETSRDNWKCTFCVLKANQKLQMQMRRKEILNSPVSENKLHCEYLLLCMYKGDQLHVFSGNPTRADAEWGSVISEPMWLDKVRNKLQDHEYRTVREFVCDINLIFKNCQALNKGNEFGEMGDKLNKTFEKEFQSIFKL